MAKHLTDEPAGATPPAPHPGKPGPPRVIPEYLQSEEGKTVTPTRVATYPAEAAAGWKRFLVVGRVPHESAHPPVYVLAPDREAAVQAYREHHELTGLAPGEEA